MQKQSFLDLFSSQAPAKREKPQTQMMALLGSDDPRAAVQALGEVAFHDLVHGVGLHEAADLMALASGEQVQACFDMDLWRKDSLNDDAMMPWLEAWLEIEDEDFVRLFYEIDPELIPLILKRNVQVFASDDRNEEPVIPNEEQFIIRRSPDFVYWIAYPDNEEKAARLQALVERLYVTLGVERAWSILEGMQWELETDLEETAYRFRNTRMQALGFPTWEEAAAIYAQLDVESEAARLRRAPVVALHVGEVEESRLFVDALQEIDETSRGDTFLRRVLQRVQPISLFKSQLLRLSNAVAVADGWDAVNHEAFSVAMKEAMDRINVGLEYLSEKDEEFAAELLKIIPIQRIFTFAFNLSLSLAKTLAPLLERGLLSIIDDSPLSLLDDQQRDIVNGLLQEKPRPRYSTMDGFATLGDIEQSALQIADLAFLELFVYAVLKRSREDLARLAYENDLIGGVESVSFDKLILTYLTRKYRNDADLWAPFDESKYPSREELLAAVQVDNVQSMMSETTNPTLEMSFIRLLARLERMVELQYPENIRKIEPEFVNLVLCV
ncbi:MAG: DUF6178 family protein [Bradymonadales bacterium]